MRKLARAFGEYLRYHRKSLLLIALCGGIFALVFSLYDLPAEAVLYALLLCVLVALLLVCADFTVFYRRHRLLCDLYSRITLSLDGLPAPKDLLETDYQDLIEAVYDEKSRVTSAADSRMSEMLDYYTLWLHQVKTPIAAMHLLLQELDDGPRAALDAELFKIEQYTDMALTYLRLESSSTDYVLRRCDLDAVVKRAVRKFAGFFVRGRISLAYDGLRYTALTDEKWLQFAVEQLLSNALKYTPGGKISIRMDGDCLVIADTGIGIAAEDLPRIFDKGFTGYNGRTDRKSTGLGLYLCRRILARLSHTLEITSAPGAGTTVRIGLGTADLQDE